MKLLAVVHAMEAKQHGKISKLVQVQAQEYTNSHASRLRLIVALPIILEKDLNSNGTIPGGVIEGTTQVAELASLLSAATITLPKAQLSIASGAREQGSVTAKEMVAPPTSYA